MENISYVKAVEILDSRTQEIASNLLSLKISYTLYLGLFAWEKVDKFSSSQDRQNWTHAVDVGISR